MNNTQINIADISKRLIKVRVKISGWYGQVQSKEGQRELAGLHSADVDRVKAGVAMLPKSITDEIRRHTIGIRQLVKSNSLPFQDGGTRIMEATKYQKMNKELDQLIEKYRTFIYDEVVMKYDELFYMAEQKLNGLFRADRFPSRDSIQFRYGVARMIDTINDPSELTISGLTEAEMNQIRQDTIQEYSDQLVNGQRELLEELSKLIGNIVEKIDKPKARFKGAVRNLVTLCDSISNLNYLEMPEIDEIATEVKTKLGNIEADTIKESTRVQKKVKEDGASLIEKLDDIKF